MMFKPNIVRNIGKKLVLGTIVQRVGPSYNALVASLQPEQHSLLLSAVHELASLLLDKSALDELVTKYATEGQSVNVGDLGSVLSFVDDIGALDWVIDKVTPTLNASRATQVATEGEIQQAAGHQGSKIKLVTCPHCKSRFVENDSNSVILE